MTDKKPEQGKPSGGGARSPAPTRTALSEGTRFVAKDYATNPKAPKGSWVCAPTSSKGPYDTKPAQDTEAPHYCGQCVSYVKTLCPTLPPTAGWKRGDLVKTSADIEEGTVIANFDSSQKYMGHAAIYVSKNKDGINVYDQWVTGDGKAIGARPLTYGGKGSSNDGNLFYIVMS